MPEPCRIWTLTRFVYTAAEVVEILDAEAIEFKRCGLCACLVPAADEDDHLRWHVSLVG